MKGRVLICCLILAALGLVPAAISAQTDVVTNRYDGARMGANLGETTLTASNVNVNQFGKLYSYPVDGSVYAQPLYVANLLLQGARHNVLFIATMNDKVYAFDADSASSSPLWMTDFTQPPSVTAVPMTDIVSPSRNIYHNVGIEGTPVIDRTTSTLYLVARTKESGTYVQRLHALDITTGGERPGSPVTIAGTVPGSATDSTTGSTGQVVAFDPKMHQQRPALALTNGVVLVAWAGHEDKKPYHGWIMGFDATTLATVGVFAVTPDADSGGIWQSGRAPTIDAAGNAYFATGNGKFDGTRNFGDSLLKFSVGRSGIALVDYFTPGNEATLNVNDDDLSGSGFTLLPGNVLIGGGKEGVLYLLDADNLGHKQKDDPQAQKIVVNGGHVMGGPVYWNSATAGPIVYNWNEDDVLVAYRFENGRLTTTPYAQGVARSPGHPGGSLTVSANGSAAATGIVWASIPTSRDVKNAQGPGMMRAYNAETLQEIWTSEQNPARDRVGTMIKFVPPVVANGKVYLTNDNNAVVVYGLLPEADFSISATPGTNAIPAGTSATFSVKVDAPAAFAGRVDLTAGGAPSGTTVSVNPSSITGAGMATMTVSVPASAPAGSFSLTVTGTNGPRVHSAPVVITIPPTADRSDPEEIVLQAATARRIAGSWRVIPDPTAAGGARLEHPDAGAAKVTSPLANPVDYFELTFAAKANVPYRLWLRGRAQNDSYNNDSVYVQFSGATSATGAPVNRIGTTQASTVVLEDCSGCGVSGWGWQDNGYGANVLGPAMYFDGSPQTIRIQGREDGISIDQIVLSPVAYLTTSPGLTKNDTTILIPPRTTGTVVLYPATASVVQGTWHVVNDTTAAGGSRIEQPDAGAAKIATPAPNPANYFELSFTAEAGKPYRLWLRARAQNNSYNNDSVYVQFSGSVTASGAPINRIQTAEAVPVVLEDCSGCGVSGWGWQDNGYGLGVLGSEMYFTAGPQTIRIQAREDGISIDHIVLSPDTYLETPPGAPRNDTTILNRTP